MKQYKTLAEDLGSAFDESVKSIQLNVLVLGPSIDSAKSNRAAFLRKKILKRCADLGAAVLPVVAELKELVKEAKKKMGKGYDLCAYEARLATKCDVIIILPASPGSFAELGMFSRDDDTCQKSLVLFDSRYKADRSFIKEGPRRAYKHRGAIVINVDYKKTEHVLKKVTNHIEVKRAVKMDRKLLVGAL